MNKRSRKYFKWLRYLKEQELVESGVMGVIPMSERGGIHFPYNPYESFMGLIPYIEAKKNGLTVSEFQDRCWRYGSGVDKKCKITNMNWIPISTLPTRPKKKPQTVELLFWDNAAKDIKRGYYRVYETDDNSYYYCDHTDIDNLTHYAFLPKPPFFDIDMGKGKCMEKGCRKYAVCDYNGHGHWVCQSCDDSLQSDFEDEYR